MHGRPRPSQGMKQSQLVREVGWVVLVREGCEREQQQVGLSWFGS